MTKRSGAKPPATPRRLAYLSSNAKLTECLCPMCRQRHVLNIFWSGDTVPHYFCARCAKKVGRLGVFAEAPGEDIIRSSIKSPKDYLASSRIADVSDSGEDGDAGTD